VENFHQFEKLKHSTVNPKAFTEKGLYMLATILKSPVATQATISIIETFTKIRELSRNVKELSAVPANFHALLGASAPPFKNKETKNGHTQSPVLSPRVLVPSPVFGFRGL